MKKIFLAALVFLLVAGLAGNVSAQDAPYLFSVEKLSVNVYWNADGTMSLDYVWFFRNGANSHPIDFVDVGLPNSSFDFGSISADVDGVLVSVSASDYQGNGSGVAVVLGDRQIPAGGSGAVHVYVGKIANVLHPDTEDENYASAVFAPTWFGSQYVTGATEMTVNFHLPPNMAENEPRWHKAPSGFPAKPASYYDEQNRVVYTWYSTNAQASVYYEFGASFPRSYVPPESIVVASPASSFDFETLMILFFGCIFFFIGVVSPIFTIIQQNRRKLQYFPPKVSIEGHGIKRGLTAVEAATLLEQPLDKVMTMILFGVVKKNAAKVKTRDPLELEIAEPLPEGLRPYEQSFLAAFQTAGKRERQKQLQEMTVALIKSVSEKMRGFSRKETADYYKSIMEKAWKMVEEADTPEVKSQRMEEALEWTMLDKNYDDRARRVFREPIFLPRWWGNYDPAYRPMPAASSSSQPVSAPTSNAPRQGLPGADFAASVVTGVQTFSQKVIGDINAFTQSVTGKTNPPPAVSPSRSGGGGGRSCACACACAGCACACAGGGR